MRRTDGAFLRPDVRHKRFRRPFPRVEHPREAGVGLKDETLAANRQRPPEYRLVFTQSLGRGV